MSDDWIILIPEEVETIVNLDRLQLASARLWEIAPESAGITILQSESVKFFDCGANFERVSCPSCSSPLPIDWWQDQMNGQSSFGFPLERIAMPCCNFKCTLHDLRYDWPQGFARSGIEAMNPNIGLLSEAQKNELEEILGCGLRIIYQHI